MAEISFGGLATGLPTEELISGLMGIERRPLERLEKQKTLESDRLRAFAEFKTKLDDLRGAVGDMNITSAVRSTAVKIAADAPFTASSQGAPPGNFDVAVVQLAQVQKTVSGGFASETAALGTGTLTLGDEVITLDAENNSLAALAAAINERSSQTGVQAAIINDGSSTTPFRLILTGADAQTTFTPDLALTDAQGAPVDLGFVEVRAAQQAVVYVDSIKVVSNSNTLSGVIPGVTLSLTDVSDKLSEGTAEVGVSPEDWADPPQYQTNLMTLEADTEALKGKVSKFVETYNAVMDWISSGYIEFGAAVTTTTTTPEGEEPVDSLALLVRGDATINNVKRRLQNLLSTPVENSGGLSALSQLGIATQRDGSLKLDTATLDTRLAENFDDVTKLLAGDEEVDGVMKGFNTGLLQMTSGTTGVYAGKKDRYDAVAKRIDAQVLNTEAMLQKKEDTMRARFTAMELLVSGLNSQSSFLTQQMDLMSNMMSGR